MPVMTAPLDAASLKRPPETARRAQLAGCAPICEKAARGGAFRELRRRALPLDRRVLSDEALEDKLEKVVKLLKYFGAR